jgi:hypothetical protein
MCIYSMVIDHFEPLIPWPKRDLTWPPQQEQTTSPLTPEQVKMLEEILGQFKKAADAAKIVDDLTGQKDCVDPEKEKLLTRVAELEKQIAKMKKSRKPKTKAKKPVSEKRRAR